MASLCIWAILLLYGLWVESLLIQAAACKASESVWCGNAKLLLSDGLQTLTAI